jgi:hypothetical protein
VQADLQLKRRRDAILALIVALVAGVVPLLGKPTAAAAFDDDWSYTRMAVSVERTGAYQFDGWGSPVVGPQAYWGALFMRMFGESNFVLRCSVLVLAAGAAGLLYAIARMGGLSRGNSFQAALVCMLSPLVIPLSASFMTDVPGFFLALAAVAVACLITREKSSGVRTPLYALFLLVAWMSGLVRQVDWVLLIGVPPMLIVWFARTPSARWMWAALWAIALICLAGTIRHIAAQPFAVSDANSVWPALVDVVRRPDLFVVFAARSVLTLAMLCMPALAGLWWSHRRGSGRGWAIALLLATGMAGIGVALVSVRMISDPWLGNIVDRHGIMDVNLNILGSKPILVPAYIDVPLAAAAWLAVAWAIRWAWRGVRGAARLAGDWRARRVAGAINWPVVFLAAYAAPTLALSLCRFKDGLFDRYLLPCIPLIVIGAALARQRRAGPAGSKITWCLTTLWAMVGVGMLFTYHQELRARLEAVSRLEAMGIPRTQISAGFELDAAVQLEQWGYMNSPRFHNPPTAYVPLEINPAWPAWFYLWKETPAIEPRYILSRSPLPGFHEMQRIEFASCFRPFHQTLFVLRPDAKWGPALVRTQ